MAGVRIYHPTARSGVFTVEHHKRPYGRYNPSLRKFEATPLLCPLCQRAHAVKTYHVTVDHDGFAIVSAEVWEMLQRHSPGQFSMANEVGNPPSLIIGMQPAFVPRPQSLDERN